MLNDLGQQGVRVRSDLVPDDLWERVAPLLPPAPERRRHPGRLRVPDRAALAGVMYVLRTGVAWRDVPAEKVGQLAVTLTGGNRHDVTSGCRCSTRSRRSGVCGDGLAASRATCMPTGATTSTSTAACCGSAASPMIARRGVAHGSGFGKVRWVVERSFAWLHQFKRLRIRYERRADLHQGLLELACSLICLRRLRTSR